MYNEAIHPVGSFDQRTVNENQTWLRQSINEIREESTGNKDMDDGTRKRANSLQTFNSPLLWLSPIRRTIDYMAFIRWTLNTLNNKNIFQIDGFSHKLSFTPLIYNEIRTTCTCVQNHKCHKHRITWLNNFQNEGFLTFNVSNNLFLQPYSVISKKRVYGSIDFQWKALHSGLKHGDDT